MKVLFLACAMFISTQLMAVWVPFGPEGVVANSVCFNAHNEYPFSVCHDEGISLYEPVNQEWITFHSDLPVKDAFYLNGTKILVILGDGTDSDGIYAFDPVTEQFELIEYIETPHFIYFIEDEQVYYIGYRFGLMTSTDGWNWNSVAALENCNILDMQSYQDHYAVAQLDNLYGVWYSADAGMTWNAPIPGCPVISDLAFDHNGKLYGIFPDESWSSGLWSSSTFGQIWEVEFWSVNMSSVCIDVMNSVFVGWDENEMGMDEGIAYYDPPSGFLNFMNDGLSNLTINKISVNPWMSAIALFCCTDSGAYVNYDYVALNPGNPGKKEAYLKVCPNPVHGIADIHYHAGVWNPQTGLCIYGADGKLVYFHNLSQATGSIKIDLSFLMRGLYYVQLKGLTRPVLSKVVIR